MTGGLGCLGGIGGAMGRPPRLDNWVSAKRVPTIYGYLLVIYLPPGVPRGGSEAPGLGGENGH